MIFFYKMSGCNKCLSKEYRQNIIKLRNKSYDWNKILSKQWRSSWGKDWVNTFLDITKCPTKVAAGTFKCVYIFDVWKKKKDINTTEKLVVSVAYSGDLKTLDKWNEAKYNKFKQIKGIQPNLNYPEERHKIFTKGKAGYLVSRLPYCSGELFDKIQTYKPSQTVNVDDIFRPYKQLMMTLVQLHKNNIYLVDIKPENIFVCGETLSFGDLDSAIIYQGDDQFKQAQIIGTPGYDPLVFDAARFEGKDRKKSLEINDLYALSVIICMVYERLFVDEQNWCALNILYYPDLNSKKEGTPRLKITYDVSKLGPYAATFGLVSGAKDFINLYYSTGKLTDEEFLELYKENKFEKLHEEKANITRQWIRTKLKF